MTATAAAGALPATRPSTISGFFPILRGLLFAVIGFVIGALIGPYVPVLQWIGHFLHLVH